MISRKAGTKTPVFPALKYREQKEGCWRGGRLGRWIKLVMGIEEGTSYEYQVLYISDESRNSTQEVKLHCMLTH